MRIAPRGTPKMGLWMCVERTGPTLPHPELGRETVQRRRYWRETRWETRSVHPLPSPPCRAGKCGILTEYR